MQTINFCRPTKLDNNYLHNWKEIISIPQHIF